MKYSVTQFEDEKQPMAFTNNILGNYSAEYFLGNFNAQKSQFLTNSTNSQVQKISQPDSSKCINIIDKPCINTFFWTLYFDGSKSGEFVGDGCILINLEGEKTMMACRLEFECTNNTTEYEAMVEGL